MGITFASATCKGGSEHPSLPPITARLHERNSSVNAHACRCVITSRCPIEWTRAVTSRAPCPPIIIPISGGPGGFHSRSGMVPVGAWAALAASVAVTRHAQVLPALPWFGRSRAAACCRCVGASAESSVGPAPAAVAPSTVSTFGGYKQRYLGCQVQSALECGHCSGQPEAPLVRVPLESMRPAACRDCGLALAPACSSCARDRTARSSPTPHPPLGGARECGLCNAACVRGAFLPSAQTAFLQPLTHWLLSRCRSPDHARPRRCSCPPPCRSTPDAPAAAWQHQAPRPLAYG